MFSWIVNSGYGWVLVLAGVMFGRKFYLWLFPPKGGR